jgi:hypothetical protein
MGPIRIFDRKFNQKAEDLAFWLSKTPAERIEAVEFLRRQCLYALGRTVEPRLDKVIRLLPLRA